VRNRWTEECYALLRISVGAASAMGPETSDSMARARCFEAVVGHVSCSDARPSVVATPSIRSAALDQLRLTQSCPGSTDAWAGLRGSGYCNEPTNQGSVAPSDSLRPAPGHTHGAADGGRGGSGVTTTSVRHRSPAGGSGGGSLVPTARRREHDARSDHVRRRVACGSVDDAHGAGQLVDGVGSDDSGAADYEGSHVLPGRCPVATCRGSGDERASPPGNGAVRPGDSSPV
jgi:hypothetical protein